MSILRFSVGVLAMFAVVFGISFFAVRNKEKAARIILALLRPIFKAFGAVYNGFVWFFF